MHALAGQRVEVQRQARDEGFALTGLHLGDLSLVEHDAADKLDVEMAQADGPAAGLAAEGKGLDQELVEVMVLPGLLAQRVGAGAQACVIERFELWLQRVDRLGHGMVALDLALVGVQKLGENAQGAEIEVTRPARI